MGVVLIAECTCGYKSNDLYEGPGFMDCNEIVICENCAKVSYADKNPDNSPLHQCSCGSLSISYSEHPKTIKVELTESDLFMDAGSLSFQSSNNYCPKCQEYHLNFIDQGLWD